MSPTAVPRSLALRLAGLVYGCRRLEITFTGAGPDFPTSPHPTVQALGLLAEARGLGENALEILRKHPYDWPVLAAMAEDERAQALSAARDIINAPKAWAAINAIAGAIRARGNLPEAEVSLIVERMTAGS